MFFFFFQLIVNYYYFFTSNLIMWTKLQLCETRLKLTNQRDWHKLLFCAKVWNCVVRQTISQLFINSQKSSLTVVSVNFSKKLVYYCYYISDICQLTGIVTDSSAYDQSKRLRTGGDYSHAAYTTPSPFHPPPAPVWAPHGQ